MCWSESQRSRRRVAVILGACALMLGACGDDTDGGGAGPGSDGGGDSSYSLTVDGDITYSGTGKGASCGMDRDQISMTGVDAGAAGTAEFVYAYADLERPIDEVGEYAIVGITVGTGGADVEGGLDAFRGGTGSFVVEEISGQDGILGSSLRVQGTVSVDVAGEGRDDHWAPSLSATITSDDYVCSMLPAPEPAGG